MFGSHATWRRCSGVVRLLRFVSWLARLLGCCLSLGPSLPVWFRGGVKGNVEMNHSVQAVPRASCTLVDFRGVEKVTIKWPPGGRLIRSLGILSGTPLTDPPAYDLRRQGGRPACWLRTAIRVSQPREPKASEMSQPGELTS